MTWFPFIRPGGGGVGGRSVQKHNQFTGHSPPFPYSSAPGPQSVTGAIWEDMWRVLLVESVAPW